MNSKFRLYFTTTLAMSSVVFGCFLSDFGRSRAEGEQIELCHYKKVFGDDFNDLSVSRSNNERTRWSAHTPWNGDFGDAKFIDPIDIYADPKKNEPFSVENGILTIRARKHGNGKWTSGLLSSADPTSAGFSLQYGYFEARMKLPPGAGVWPAFWLNANAHKGDKTPSLEVDVLEYYGRSPDEFHSVWHLWYNDDSKRHKTATILTKIPSGSLNDRFHTYGAEVTKDWIVFYFDRREIGRQPTPPEHTKPLMVLVNLALGAGWPIDQTPNPSELLVDYIYAFAPDETKRDAVCNE